MNDGDEHEVPRPKLVGTGCRLFWHRDWVWEGDTRGEWSIAEIEILWGERGYISMKWGLERWWVMMMMWWSVWGSEILWGEGGYVSMLGGLCEDWCDVVRYWVFSIIEILWGEWVLVSMKWGLERWWVMMMMMRWGVCGSEILWGEGWYVSMLGGLCEDWCDVVMPLSFLYNSNFMWWTTNYLYEMRFVWIVVWCRDATQMSLQFKFHVMNDQLSLWNEVRMDSCVRVVMYCECFVFSIIQISCDEWPTISMK